MTDSISMETVAITVSCSAGSERESSVNEPATGQGSEDLEPVSVNPELEAAGHSQHSKFAGLYYPWSYIDNNNLSILTF